MDLWCQFCCTVAPHKQWGLSLNSAPLVYLSVLGLIPQYIYYFDIVVYLNIVKNKLSPSNLRLNYPWTFILPYNF